MICVALAGSGFLATLSWKSFVAQQPSFAQLVGKSTDLPGTTPFGCGICHDQLQRHINLRTFSSFWLQVQKVVYKSELSNDAGVFASEVAKVPTSKVFVVKRVVLSSQSVEIFRILRMCSPVPSLQIFKVLLLLHKFALLRPWPTPSTTSKTSKGQRSHTPVLGFPPCPFRDQSRGWRYFEASPGPCLRCPLIFHDLSRVAAWIQIFHIFPWPSQPVTSCNYYDLLYNYEC